MNKRNENRPGYKKTKVGWIPEGWECMRLKNCTTKIGSGITPKGGEKVYVSSGIAFIRSQNVLAGNFSFEGLKNITFEQHQKMKSTSLRTGDVLYNITGASIGRCCLFPDNLGDANLNQHVCIIRPNKIISKIFLAIALNSHLAQKQLYENQAGGGREGLNFENLGLFKIPLPPLPEQKKIAEILSTWDKAFEHVNKLISAKTKHKKALMQQLLTGKWRFKEFEKDITKSNTRYGVIPSDWSYPKVGEIAEEVSNRNTNNSNITVLSCTKYDGLVESLKYFSRQVFSKDTSTYKVVKRGQFAYATNHIEEGSIGMLDILDEGLVSPMYTVFQTGDRVYIPFLYKVFKTELYRHGFALIHVPLPSFDEQQKISDCIDAIDREIKLLKKKVVTLKNQKKGIMQKLLTGKIRVRI
jgi:type I restriction enzyme S subunit